MIKGGMTVDKEIAGCGFPSGVYLLRREIKELAVDQFNSEHHSVV
jgi:hypothetical protein